MKKLLKLGILSSFVILILIAVSYFFVVPKIVSSYGFIEFVQKNVKKSFDANLILDKPMLTTSPKLIVDFKTKSIVLEKNGETLLSAENLHCNLSLKKILLKQIILNKFGADDVFADVNKLQTLSVEDKKEAKPSPIKLKLSNSDLYIKKCLVLYKTDDNVLIKLFAHDLEITKEREPKHIHFSILTDIEFDKQRFRLLFKDFDTIYFKNKKLNLDNFKFIVDKSMVSVNGHIDENGKYDITVKSDKFNVKNVKSALDSNLIIPNGREILACFKDLGGDFDFNFNVTNKDLNGSIKLNKISAKLIPLANLPFTLTSGYAKINSKDINLSDFDGWYGSNKINKIQMYGDVKNYTKTANTDIALKGDASNELAKYISKISGCNFTLKGLSKFAFKIAYDISGNVRVMGGAKIPKGADLLVEGSTISPSKYDRALGIKLNVLNDDLKIEHINYYISDFIEEKKSRPVSKPLVTVSSHLNMISGKIHKLAFNIPEPLPSEFFNVLVNQRLFRNGTFSGNLEYINTNPQNPYINSNITLKDVRVVGQSLSIKNGKAISNNQLVHLNADGRFRRTNYKFDCDIQNRMLFPIIVKDIDINLDELDVEKVMQSFAPRPQLTEAQRQEFRKRMLELQAKEAKSDVPLKYFEVEQNTQTAQTNSEDDAPIEFKPNLIAIKNCKFNVAKGQYKKINFGDLHANLTLTEKGILEIKSNRFNFADGFSSLKVYCDMVKQNYSIKLGAKDVNSDIIASSILNLPREISGKASALMELYSDKNMKLNGQIKFSINNGSITKLGLVQYILNMASIFRNPVVMISPSTLIDLVSVPESSFKTITGDLRIRNNIMDRMMIKSSSSQLSAFIVGQINLENFDSSLRIYTKFSGKNKGIAGILRNVSLNSLARKSKLGQEEVSYYASELAQLPKLETGEEHAQVFLTKVDGDVQTTNFISSLKKIK